MTASSPVTMEDLVNGLKFITGNTEEAAIVETSGQYKLSIGSDEFNTVSLSSDGLTISFSGELGGGPNFTGFTFNA